MTLVFLILAILLAILDWVAVAGKWKKIEFFAKPAVMLALIALLITKGGAQGHLIWFLMGILFSMFGDIFLMLPKEQFIPGLVSFLLAHIAYLIGFTTTMPNINLPSIILFLIIFITAYQIFIRIAAGLDSSQNRDLKIPVFLYTIIISLMLLSALLTLLRPEWRFLTAMAVSLGALSFYLSDTFLAWNKFVQPIRHGNLIVIISYHFGQILIVMGAAYHFGTI